MQYIIVEWIRVEYSTLLCSAVQYSTLHNSIIQCNSVQYSAVHYTTVHCRTVMNEDIKNLWAVLH